MINDESILYHNTYCIFASCEQTPYENLDFQLVWSDEFNSDDLQSNWNHEIGDGCEYGIQFWDNFENSII